MYSMCHSLRLLLVMCRLSRVYRLMGTRSLRLRSYLTLAWHAVRSSIFVSGKVMGTLRIVG